MPTWERTQYSSAYNVAHSEILGTIPEGSTLLRVHAGVRFSLLTYGFANPGEIMGWGMGCGIYTTLEDGGTLIYPISDNADQDPPLQRWLWLERLNPTPQPMQAGGYAQSWMWTSTPAANPIDVKAQVKATSALNLNLSWEPTATLPDDISLTQLTYWASFLYGT